MLKKILLGIVALVGIGFTVIVGVVFFSPVPFKLMAKGFEKNGIFIEGIQGSLNSGIRIEKLKTENEKYAIEFEGTEMRWSNFFKTFIAKKVAIELLETRKALVVVKKVAQVPAPPSSDDAQQAPTQEEVSPEEAPLASQEPSVFQSPENPNGIMEFRVDNVSLRDVTIRDENRNQEFVLQELSVRNLVSTYKKMLLEQFLVESNQFSISVENVTFHNDVLEFPNQLTGILKTQFMPELLRKDLKFSLTGKIANKVPENFEFKFDEEKISVKFDEKGIALAVNEFTPSEYFVTEFPVSKISAKAFVLGLEQAKKGQIPLEGSFQLAQKSFRLDTSKPVWAATVESGDPYKVFMAPAQLVMGLMMGSGGKSLLELSGTRKELDKNLAQLFYSKNSEELSPEQVAELQKFAFYFKDPSQPETELVPLATITPVKSLKGRQPASVKKGKPLKTKKLKVRAGK